MVRPRSGWSDYRRRPCTSISEDDVQDTESTLEDVLPEDQAFHNREVSPSLEPEDIVVSASTDQTVEIRADVR